MGHRSRRISKARFVAIPNATVDHLEVRSPIALGLLAINLRHADGMPITLDRVQRNAEHGSRRLYAQARHILIDDGYAIYLSYSACPEQGGRPEWESLTQYANAPHGPDELAELVHEHTPGRWITVKDGPKPEQWRRVQVVSAQVTCWQGTFAVNKVGRLEQKGTRAATGGKRTSIRDEVGRFVPKKN